MKKHNVIEKFQNTGTIMQVAKSQMMDPVSNNPNVKDLRFLKAKHSKEWEQKIFWVNNKQTHAEETKGNYIWAPFTNANGSQNQSYKNLEEAKPGDIIFAYARGYIQAIGLVTSRAYQHANPFDNAGWGKNGNKVDVKFYKVPKKFKPKDFIEEIKPLLPEKYSPINKEGNGNQGSYLAEISSALGAYLLDKVDPNRTLPFTQSDEYSELPFPPTVRNQITLARIGQNVFRKKLLCIYQNQCALTGINVPFLLRASHIKPWHTSNDLERLDSNNGILLATHVDILFDRGLISFDDNGNVLTKNSEVDDLLNSMNVISRKISLPKESIKYLKWHRDEFEFNDD